MVTENAFCQSPAAMVVRFGTAVPAEHQSSQPMGSQKTGMESPTICQHASPDHLNLKSPPANRPTPKTKLLERAKISCIFATLENLHKKMGGLPRSSRLIGGKCACGDQTEATKAPSDGPPIFFNPIWRLFGFTVRPVEAKIATLSGMSANI